MGTSNNIGYPPDMISKRLGELQINGYLNQSLRDSLVLLSSGLRDETVKAGARTLEDKIARYSVVLGGIEGGNRYAELWANGKYDQVGDRFKSEARLRLGLADQIFTAIRGGGLATPEGNLNSNVVEFVLSKVDELDPSLNNDVRSELTSPHSVEGN